MQRTIIIGDLHLSPKTEWSDRHRIECIGDFIRENNPDHLVLIGDVASMDSVCKHEGNHTKRGKTKPSLEDDFAHLEDCLDILYKKMRRKNQNHNKINLFVTLGNHDWQRLLVFEDEHPETVGCFVPRMWNLYEDRGFLPTKYGDWVEIDNVLYSHIPIFCGKEITGQYAEERALKCSQKSLVFGHTHRFKLITEGKFGSNEPLFALNPGCALPHGYIEPYARHSLNSWSWYGAVILETERGNLRGIHAISSEEMYKGPVK